MKNILIALAVALTGTGIATAQQNKNAMTVKTLFDYTATDIDGKEFSMSSLKGKKIMIVNVASECGYTPQYKDLQKLYAEYKDKGLVILGFPCNQFAGQEPGTNDEIQSFCEKNYGVTFPLFSKIQVSGKGQHPIYQWLTKKELNGVEDSEVSWNFNKYLVDGDGHYVKHLKSGVKPDDAAIIDWLNSK